MCASHRVGSWASSGATHIPIGYLPRRLTEIPVTADRGALPGRRRSAIATSVLQRLGITGARDLVGGFHAWAQSGGTVVRDGQRVMKLPRDLTAPLVDQLCERSRRSPSRRGSTSSRRSGSESRASPISSSTPARPGQCLTHLQQLMSAGFIRRRKEGTFAYYSLADEDVLKLCDIMCGRIDADARERRHGSARCAETDTGE